MTPGERVRVAVIEHAARKAGWSEARIGWWRQRVETLSDPRRIEQWARWVKEGL